MDDDQPRAGHAPARKSRRLRKALAALALLSVATVAFLPWLLGTTPARWWLIGRINAQFAPGSVELARLSLSWTGPIELSGVALRDPKGKLVLTARRTRLDRGLLGMLAARPDYGTITVEGVTVDVDRRADGSIDLLDALGLGGPGPAVGAIPPGPAPVKPGPAADPKLAFVVLVKGGTLRIVSPELVDPFVAGSVNGSATLVAGKPLELAATLSDKVGSLELQATIDHRAPADSPGDQSLKVAGKGWPIHVRQSGLTARGRYDGTLEAKRERGLWTVRGAPSLREFEAIGPALLGDRLTLDRVDAACDLGQSASGWAIRRFDVNSRVGSITAVGAVPAVDGSPAQVRGRVDLAAMAKMLPHAMRLRDGLTLDRGLAVVRADLATHRGSERVELAASLDDLVAVEAGRPFALREPVRLTASAVRGGGKATVEKVEVKAAGVDVTGGGDLDTIVKLSGTVDLPLLVAQLRDLLDLGAIDLAGHARLAADYRKDGEYYRARLAADCQGLKVAGLTAAPIVREKVRLDASAHGLRAPDGSPVGWESARLDLKAGDVKLDVSATDRAGSVALLASAEAAVTMPAPALAELRTSLRWEGRAFEVDDLRVGLIPIDPAAATQVIALAVRGRLDLASGEGAFAAIPGLPLAAIGLAPDGLKLSGLGRADLPIRVEAALLGDLAALDRLLAAWSGSPVKGLAGAWASRASVTRSATGRLDLDGRFDAADLAALGLPGPLAVGIRGGYAPEVDRLDLATIDLATGYGRVVLDGSLAEASRGRQILDVKAQVEPRWEVIDRKLAASAGPTARLRATARPWRLKGQLKADSAPQRLAQLEGEVGLDVTEARAFGVVVGPTPVVLRMGAGRAAFDPIRTTANGGPVAVVADLGFDEAYGLWLRLRDGTRIDGAAINDDVSQAVLAYIAPVLSKATVVGGKFSVALNPAFVPITGTGSMALDGLVAFSDVQFRPGPLGAEIVALSGRPAPDLRLNELINVHVSDRRATQTGLTIPLGGDARVTLDGSVGFDETVDLRATVPVSSRMLGLGPQFDQAVGGSSLTIPIRGTLARPAVDRQALRVALRDLARSMAGRGLEDEARRLLDRVAGPNPGGDPAKVRPGTGRRDPLKDLESLGRDLIDPRKPR